MLVAILTVVLGKPGAAPSLGSYFWAPLTPISVSVGAKAESPQSRSWGVRTLLAGSHGAVGKGHMQVACGSLGGSPPLTLTLLPTCPELRDCQLLG